MIEIHQLPTAVKTELMILADTFPGYQTEDWIEAFVRIQTDPIVYEDRVLIGAVRWYSSSRARQQQTVRLYDQAASEDNNEAQRPRLVLIPTLDLAS